MKVASHRSGLISALDNMVKVVPSAKTSPILSYVLLRASGGTITLTATDLATSVSVPLNGAVAASDGVMLLPAVDMLTALRSAAPSAVLITGEDKSIVLSAGATSWKWKVLDVDQFPQIVNPDEAIIHTLNRKDFLDALRIVKSAASNGSFKSSLEQIGVRQGKVQAADGVRFHEVALVGTELIDTALPLNFVDDVLSVMGKCSDDDIQFGTSEDGSALILTTPVSRISLASRTKETKFPDVKSAFLIPAMNNTDKIKVKRADLLSAIKRVRIISDSDTRAIELHLLDFTSMEIISHQRNGSVAKEELAVTWDGTKRKIVFNVDYLLDLLGLFNSETLSLQLGPDQKHKPSSLLIQDSYCSGVLQQLRLGGLA